jgi:hypothetical protein
MMALMQTWLRWERMGMIIDEIGRMTRGRSMRSKRTVVNEGLGRSIGIQSMKSFVQSRIQKFPLLNCKSLFLILIP